MAEVEIQRKQGAAWWPWLLAAVLIAGLVWLVVEANDRDVATTPGAATSATGEFGDARPAEAESAPGTAAAATAALPLAAIQANPDNYFGREISGLATITEVAGDRAFWIEQDGQRMLVVVDEAADAATVAAGREVSLTGTVINPDSMRQDAPGVTSLDDATLRMMQGLPAFLRASNIEVQAADGVETASNR